MIRFKQVTKSFRIGVSWSQVLSPIDLTIESGSFMSIMGPSGSGKTTLMNIVGCLDRPTTGNIYWMMNSLVHRVIASSQRYEMKKSDLFFSSFIYYRDSQRGKMLSCQ